MWSTRFLTRKMHWGKTVKMLQDEQKITIGKSSSPLETDTELCLNRKTRGSFPLS